MQGFHFGVKYLIVTSKRLGYVCNPRSLTEGTETSEDRQIGISLREIPHSMSVPEAQWLEHCVSSANVVGSIPREHMY